MSHKKKPGYEMHVISNTHWDREWRHGFQHTRMMLVDVMDTLLGILDEHPEYACYHLDSHTIMLEDYLEIRPENEEKLKQYIAAERIWAGPWYTCPDMNVISGESIVRNLLLGHKVARAFGKVMKVGYTPFSFGHVAQLPQIYAGFGIDTCLVYRGVGRERAKAEFWWEAPDGTRALASQFSRRGRYNFYFHVYRPAVDGRPHDVVNMSWHEIGLPVRCSDVPNQYEAVYAMNHPPKFIAENIGPGIKALRDEDKEEFTTPYFLLMQGCDTTAPNPDEPRIIAEADAALENDRVIHSSLPAYIEKLRGAVGDLPVLGGEMRVPARIPGPSMVLLDAISARIYLKQANTRAQTALEKWAEPAAVMARQCGLPYPAPFLEIAWKHLLVNQAHDSIAGCGADVVHDDMMYRFEQVAQIADEVTRRSLSEMLRHMDSRHLEPGGSMITVWNSLPHERPAIATVTVDFPRESAPKAFTLIDNDGLEIATQIVESRPLVASVQLRSDWPQLSHVQRFTFHMDAGDLPAMGYKAFTVKPLERRRRRFGLMRRGSNAMENEHLYVAINADGTFDLTHRESGRTYQGLNAFEDSGECGTPWGRIEPEQDRTFTSLGFPSSISLDEDGPLLTRFRVATVMDLPARSDAKGRSRDTVPLSITSHITLKKGARCVEVRTRVENTVRDHRLRALFPTFLDTTHSCADTPFDVIERPIALPDSSTWKERVRGTHPQLSFVDLSNGEAGLAVISDGLPEYGVFDDATRTIALTLLRTMDEVSSEFAFPPPEHEGMQCLGAHEFRYAVYPHKGDWRAGDVPFQAANHNTPLRAMQSGRNEGTLPWRLGFVEISPRTLVFSGIKRAETRRAIVVRMFNPTSETVKGAVRTHWRVNQAFAVNLEEERQRELDLDDEHTIPIEVSKKKICSIEIMFAGTERGA
ncbi:MAG TPA: hypothetical protein HPP77_00980 [Candidatus Hydrogenedentes bacterium]|nr:hypothetical protein [Candidatus Hydrogenedentota bacterium]